ncbi:hypothetical protein ACB092_04G121100 [Castanea dentata]
MAVSSSSSSSTSGRLHDVYISVQHEDPRKYITDMIDKSLIASGVPTFKDNKQLRRRQKGTEIGKELQDAIGMSRISVVLFSKEYVSSSWCLEELVLILRCRKEWGLIVLPIFFDVDPSDIRKQRGSAAKVVGIQRLGSFWRRRWTAALTEAANLCGWDHRASNGYDICHEYLKHFLQVGSKDVIFVGICGPRRMGKTAIAKAIYNKIFYTFEGSSFLSDVAQNSKQSNDLVCLQEKLLSDILSERDIAIANCTRGMDIIKEKLCFKRVLIVLDDVDDLEQLYALIGNRNWFGVGSKIIITTRKVHLLNVLGVDQILLAQGRPLPPNIEEIWEKYQQSCHIVAGLQEYIHSLYNRRNDRVR